MSKEIPIGYLQNLFKIQGMISTKLSPLVRQSFKEGEFLACMDALKILQILVISLVSLITALSISAGIVLRKFLSSYFNESKVKSPT